MAMASNYTFVKRIIAREILLIEQLNVQRIFFQTVYIWYIYGYFAALTLPSWVILLTCLLR